MYRDNVHMYIQVVYIFTLQNVHMYTSKRKDNVYIVSTHFISVYIVSTHFIRKLESALSLKVGCKILRCVLFLVRQDVSGQ